MLSINRRALALVATACICAACGGCGGGSSLPGNGGSTVATGVAGSGSSLALTGGAVTTNQSYVTITAGTNTTDGTVCPTSVPLTSGGTTSTFTCQAADTILTLQPGGAYAASGGYTPIIGASGSYTSVAGMVHFQPTGGAAAVTASLASALGTATTMTFTSGGYSGLVLTVQPQTFGGPGGIPAGTYALVSIQGLTGGAQRCSPNGGAAVVGSNTLTCAPTDNMVISSNGMYTITNADSSAFGTGGTGVGDLQSGVVALDGTGLLVPVIANVVAAPPNSISWKIVSGSIYDGAIYTFSPISIANARPRSR